ncbi:MAG: M43 family zinc metalloprotease [Spirosomaceae bacterium]|jgi:hypothetical protein|nr:M43 family zinc metalloprotease [Spirosomataceae bacterium]
MPSKKSARPDLQSGRKEHLICNQHMARCRTYNYIWTALFLLVSLTTVWGQRCAVVKHDSVMRARYPYWALKRQMLEDSIQSHLRSPVFRNARTAATCSPIRIPVVVHIIHNRTDGIVGGVGNSNIADAQIVNQIRILNEDYRRKPGTRGFNTNTVGADTGIEFYLANIDPNGQPTNGITRQLYTQKTTFDINTDDQLLSNIVSWPTDRYLNIWVARYGSNFLGIAQFPSVSGIKGLDEENELLERTDGVFIDFRVFGSGTGTLSRLYNLGRTTTHEVGHWLGLIHTWGDTDCGDDYCADTPQAEDGNQSSICGPVFSNCNGTRTRNMTENYMDYSPDSCMNIFTKNQAERMAAVIEKAPRRARLVRYWCAQLPFGSQFSAEIAPNPASTEINIRVTQKTFGTFDVTIYNASGQLVYQQRFEDYPSWIVTIPTTSFQSGTYFARVSTAQESIIQRLVVVR